MARNTKGIEVAEMIPDQCIGCQVCTGECPVGAIEMSPEGVAVINPELCVGCGKCAQACPVGSIRFERKRRAKPPEEPGVKAEEHAPEFRGVGVFIEMRDGAAAQVSWELVGKGRDLASQRNTRVIGLLLGHEIQGTGRDALAFGCDEVHIIDHPALQTYSSQAYGQALTELCRRVMPEILLIGASPLGRDLASITATLLETGLTADCTELNIDRDTGVLLMTRPAFGGNIMATIYCQKQRPQMSTVRPRVFRLPEKQPDREGSIHAHPWTPPAVKRAETLEFIPQIAELGGIDIGRAPALVVAGKGACDAASMPLLQELADLIGGVVACSRPVVESGLMPYERQVGQTGKTVAPKLYVAVGVSGAVQHLVGMKGSEKILAINSDPDAPIFQVANAGLVGDYHEIVPALIEELKKRKALHHRGTEDTEQLK